MIVRLKKLTLCLLAAVMLLGLVPTKVFADDEPLIDEDELNAIIMEYLEEHSLTTAELGIGFCYTATGEEYYYNPDIWLYSASLYKVPLSMVYTERIANGEMDIDDTVCGYKIGKIIEEALVYSSNAFAIMAMGELGSEQEGRDLFRAFAPNLPDDYYDPLFREISAFSPRYMTNVMMTLYYEQERFPTVIDHLLVSEPHMYFRPTLGDDYEIAQKYGAYEEYNHASAIIYTPNPIIVTVMTRYVGNYSQIIGEIGKLIADYALTLDEKLVERERAMATPIPMTETPQPVVETVEVPSAEEAQPTEVPVIAEAPVPSVPQAPQSELADTDSARPAAIIALSVLTVILILIFIIRYGKKR